MRTESVAADTRALGKGAWPPRVLCSTQSRAGGGHLPLQAQGSLGPPSDTTACQGLTHPPVAAGGDLCFSKPARGSTVRLRPLMEGLGLHSAWEASSPRGPCLAGAGGSGAQGERIQNGWSTAWSGVRSARGPRRPPSSLGGARRSSFRHRGSRSPSLPPKEGHRPGVPAGLLPDTAAGGLLGSP